MLCHKNIYQTTNYLDKKLYHTSDNSFAMRGGLQQVLVKDSMTAEVLRSRKSLNQPRT